MLYIAGINITFFLFFLLLTKKEKSYSDKILAAWLFFIGIHLTIFFLHATGRYSEFPYLLGFEIPLPFVHSPFLFLYTTSLTSQSQNKAIKYFHFLPFVLAYFLFFDFLTSSFRNKIFVYDHDGIGYEKIMTFFLWILILQGVVYIILCFFKLRKHKQNIVNNFSNTDKINLNWLSYLLIGICFIWVAIIFGNDKTIFSTVVLYVIFIGYFGIKQVGIFTNKDYQKHSSEISTEADDAIDSKPDSLIDETYKNQIELPKKIQNTDANTLTEIVVNEVQIENPGKVKYEKSKISSDEINTIHQNLSMLMSKEKMYKNPELTLADVAQKVNVHPNTLSQVINSMEQKNFYDYINLQRIAEFKQIAPLPENRQYTLLSLALECGFNSKTSFNRNFKKYTHLSPTEYLIQENIQTIT